MASSSEYDRNLSSLLLQEVETQRNLMIAVATGGPRIDSVISEYRERRERIHSGLIKLGLQDPNPYADLWDWYGKWSTDLPGYVSRRQFIRQLYEPLQRQLRNAEAGLPAGTEREPTGWERVDRAVDKMRGQLATARHEEDFQRVGLLGREVLISLGQAVYDPGRHTSPDGVTPSQTDAARMLGAYIASEFGGESNEALRKHAKASLGLAVELQHKRTADFRVAALCAEAVGSVVNSIAIVSGRRDPGV